MQVQGLLLDEHARWKFWRFDVSTTLGERARQVEYALDADGLDKSVRCCKALSSSQQTSPVCVNYALPWACSILNKVCDDWGLKYLKTWPNAMKPSWRDRSGEG